MDPRLSAEKIDALRKGSRSGQSCATLAGHAWAQMRLTPRAPCHIPPTKAGEGPPPDARHGRGAFRGQVKDEIAAERRLSRAKQCGVRNRARRRPPPARWARPALYAHLICQDSRAMARHSSPLIAACRTMGSKLCADTETDLEQQTQQQARSHSLRPAVPSLRRAASPAVTLADRGRSG